MPRPSDMQHPQNQLPKPCLAIIASKQKARTLMGGTTSLTILVPLSLPYPQSGCTYYMHVIVALDGVPTSNSCTEYTNNSTKNYSIFTPSLVFIKEGEFPIPLLGQSTPPRHLPPSPTNPARLSSKRNRSHQSGAAGTGTATTLARPPPLGNRGARQCEARNDHQPEEKHTKGGIEYTPSCPWGPSPGKPCTHDGRTQQAPARKPLQVGVCWDIHRYVRLTLGPLQLGGS